MEELVCIVESVRAAGKDKWQQLASILQFRGRLTELPIRHAKSCKKKLYSLIPRQRLTRQTDVPHCIQDTIKIQGMIEELWFAGLVDDQDQNQEEIQALQYELEEGIEEIARILDLSTVVERPRIRRKTSDVTISIGSPVQFLTAEKRNGDGLTKMVDMIQDRQERRHQMLMASIELLLSERNSGNDQIRIIYFRNLNTALCNSVVLLTHATFKSSLSLLSTYITIQVFGLHCKEHDFFALLEPFQ